MATSEPSNTINYDNYKAMSSDSSLGDCLSTLLSRAREANKLGKDGKHSGESIASLETMVEDLVQSQKQEKQERIQQFKSTANEPQERELMIVLNRPSAVSTGSPRSRNSTPEAAIIGSSSPSYRLNPSASAYTPPAASVPDSAYVPPHLRLSAKQTVAYQLQLQKAYYEVQIQKAYDDGIVRGQSIAIHEGFKRVFEQGRTIGYTEGRSLMSDLDVRAKVGDGKGKLPGMAKDKLLSGN